MKKVKKNAIKANAMNNEQNKRYHIVAYCVLKARSEKEEEEIVYKGKKGKIITKRRTIKMKK